MPRTITGDDREIILKVREFFIREKKNRGPVIPFHKVHERVAAATGVSLHTVTNVVKEGIVAKAKGTKLTTPGQNRKVRKDKVILDENDLRTIKRKLEEFVAVQNKIPSVKKLHQTLKEEANIKFSREILRKYIKQMAGDTEPSPREKSKASSDSIPTSNSSKSDIMRWLTRHNIDYSSEFPKQQLLKIVKVHKAKKKFATGGNLAGTSNSGTEGETSKPKPQKPPIYRILVNQESENKPTAATGNFNKDQGNFNKDTIGNFNKDTIGNFSKETIGNFSKELSNFNKETLCNFNKETNSNFNKETIVNFNKDSIGNFNKELGNFNKEVIGNFSKETIGNFSKELVNFNKETIYGKHMGLIDTSTLQRADSIPVTWDKISGAFHKQDVFMEFGEGRPGV